MRPFCSIVPGLILAADCRTNGRVSGQRRIRRKIECQHSGSKFGEPSSSAAFQNRMRVERQHVLLSESLSFYSLLGSLRCLALFLPVAGLAAWLPLGGDRPSDAQKLALSCLGSLAWRVSGQRISLLALTWFMSSAGTSELVSWSIFLRSYMMACRRTRRGLNGCGDATSCKTVHAWGKGTGLGGGRTRGERLRIRKRPRTWSISLSGQRNEIARPFLPARPVRPIRWV